MHIADIMVDGFTGKQNRMNINQNNAKHIERKHNRLINMKLQGDPVSLPDQLQFSL